MIVSEFYDILLFVDKYMYS